MRKKSFLLGVIFSILSLSMQAQIYEVFRQGFEVTDAANYTVASGTAAPQTAFHYGGSRALKMSHVANDTTIIVLNEVDMSNYSNLNYYTLEFAHINTVSPFNTASNEVVAMIEVKLASSSSWTRLTTSYYDKTGAYSEDYAGGAGYFCNSSYPEWSSALSGMDATWWHNERFNLDRLFNNVNAANRKLNVRILLCPKTSSVIPGDQGWYLDDIVMKASSQPIVKPVISMVQYPDLLNHPSSRGAKVVIDAKAGNNSLQINPDSVYVVYKIGSSNTIHKATMSPVTGVANRYAYRLPFEGYDTMMYFRVVVKDASNNQNTQTSPLSEESWYEYRCVRGKSNTASMAETSPHTLTSFPFPTEGTAKSEFIIDSATLAAAGFGPGSITGLSMMIKSGLQTATQTRQNVQVRMKNAFTTVVASPVSSFSNDYTHVVYSGDINFPIVVNNNPYNLQLQDTFCYAGKDLIVQIIQANDHDFTTPIGIGGVNTASAAKKTLYQSDIAFVGYDPYTSNDYRTALYNDTKRPNFGFVMQGNPPLIYDAGISAIAFPSATSAATANTNQHVEVTLKNYGTNPLTGLKVYYQLDDNQPVMQQWTGNLAANATQTVTFSANQQFSAGYHTLRAWVEDTVTTTGNTRHRDHEPYNDSSFCEFIACAGAMSGTRQIGGTNADFNDMHEFLFSLSSCGISGGLTVKMAPGTYEAFTVPQFTGASATSMLTFEPLNATSQVIIESTSAAGPAVVDLQNAQYVRFNNITFQSLSEDSVNTYLVRLGTSSTGCQFNNCTFSNGTANSQALLYSGNCNSLTVSGCTFNGGNIGVDLSGLSLTQRSSGNKVQKSNFANQNTYGVYVYNQNNAEVDSNFFNNVITSSGYAVLLHNAYGNTKVTRNKIYTSHGASAIGASSVVGTATTPAIIANNMVVAEDDGTAISIVSPVNIQSASYTKIVYNSVKFAAPTRSDIAALTFGGVAIDNSCLQNNIIATLDQDNYALNYAPGTATTNVVNANVYFSQGSYLNRYGTLTYNNINAWKAAVSTDLTSARVNPSFLNGSLVDLRSFNQQLKNIAVVIPEVTVDMFGTARPATGLAVGAFQFDALFYDFEIVDVVEPFDSYCGNASAIPLRVKMYNWGVNDFTPSTSAPLYLVYSYGNVLDSVALPSTVTIASNDTTLVNTGSTLQLSATGTQDAIYNIKMWISSTSDPNNTNDTTRFVVRSNYVEAAPTAITASVPYLTRATLTANTGVSSWPVNGYNSGATMPSTIYWYENATSDSVLHRGATFVTDTLLDDTVFYFRQHRELPIIRISEVAFDNNYGSATSSVEGATYPRPSWLSTTTKVAVELTNVGNYPADLYNDTVMFTSNTSTFKNKYYRIPSHVVIQPGASVVIQFRTGVTTTDSTVTFPSTTNFTASPAALNLAVVYRHQGAICDAVATNNMTTQNEWNALNIPSYIWAGDGIATSATNAGITRLGWPTNPAATPANSAQLWRAATSDHPLTLGTTNPALILYNDNGCETPRTTATVTITGVPQVDLVVTVDPIEGGCGLGNESLTATVTNYGINNCPAAYLRYEVNGNLIQTDTLTNIASGASVTHTFSQAINMHHAVDTTFNITAYVIHDPSENANTIYNDTASITVVSLRTPDAPTAAPVSTQYAHTATLTAVAPNVSDSLVWYSRRGVALDTTSGTFVTSLLYASDTFYVSAAVVNGDNATIGTGTLESANTDKVSPFASYYRNYKSQMIWTADELRQAGVQPGPITSLTFDLSTNSATVANTPTFSTYTIYMGATQNEIFATTTSWEQNLTQVFSADNVTFTSANVGWNTFAFNTPYNWDGTSNIVVQICRTLTSNYHQTVKGHYTSKPNSCLALTNDNASVCDAVTAGSKVATRPNVKFGYVVYGCDGARTMVPVTVSGAPDYDLAIAWSDTTDYTNYASCNPIALPVKLRNQGNNNATSYSVVMKVDGDSVNTLQGTTTVVAGDSVIVNLPAYAFTPGRHVVEANVVLAGDTITTNNTISKVIPIRFCGGHYNVGPNTSFVSISAATDTLNVVGMIGSVVFDIADGTYTGQVNFGSFNGADSSRTVTFQSQSGEADGVIITATPTQADNYVVNINGSQFLTLKDLTIYGYHTTGTGNNIYASALQMGHCSQVTIDGCVVKVKSASSASTNANAIVILDSVNDVIITNSTIDSGYCGIVTKATVAGNGGNISIVNNHVHGFFQRGIYVRNLHDLTISSNLVESGATANNRALYGIYLAGHTGLLSLQKNQVYLIDNYTGGKRGISMFNTVGTSNRRAKVYNNMINCSGTGTASVMPAALLIDSASSYINLYYNTARVAIPGTTGAATRAVSVGDKVDNCTNIQVYNNIMANFASGYGYYVKSTASIPVSQGSDYNAIYSNSTANTPKYAFWGQDYSDLTSLQGATTGNERNSVPNNEQPYFMADNDLHAATGQFAGLATYLSTVTEDIDGETRPQIPAPTIGADEYERCQHDVSIVEIIKPYLPRTGDLHPTIEGKNMQVIVRFFNNGLNTETGLTWNANLVGTANSTGTRNIPAMAPRAYWTDTAYIQTQLGVVDTQFVHFQLNVPSNVTDCNPADNDTSVMIFLDPAYDLQVTSVIATGGCRPLNSNSIVNLTIKNVGLDTIPVTMPLQFGYSAYTSYNTTNNTGVRAISTFPQNVTETQYLTAFLPPNTSRVVTMNTPANLYPTGKDTNMMQVRIRGWVHCQYDLYPTGTGHNDTAISSNINSFYTPQPPVGIDNHIPYATWDTVWASQINSHPVEWYRDSTNTGSRFNQKNNYAASCHWDNGPQYFHDSTYYLRTTSAKGCISNFSTVSVHVNPLVPRDAAVQQVINPRPTGTVFATDDTVKVRLINYGSQTISSVPVTYQLFNANGTQLLQQVTETCTHDIQSGQTYDFAFDSLLQIPTPTTSATYKLRVWTDLSGEQVRLNDTIRTIHTFHSQGINGNYGTITCNTAGLDITRVALNSLNHEQFPLGYGYQNFGAYDGPELPVLHLQRGAIDTLLIACESNNGGTDRDGGVGKLGVWIDFDRSGSFSTDETNSEWIANTTLTTGHQVAIPLQVPDTSWFGYMRMRILLTGDECARIVPTGKVDAAGTTHSSIDNGSVMDYLLYIDPVAPVNDVSLSHMIGFRKHNEDSTIFVNRINHTVDSVEYEIAFNMANKGRTDLTAADINYSFVGPNDTTSGVINWTGNLQPGRSTMVTVPGYTFDEGTTVLYLSYADRDNDTTNNRLEYEFHRFHTVTVEYLDNFDGLSYWYAPKGYSRYTRNLWQLGNPTKNSIPSTASGDSAWVTDLRQPVNTGTAGSYSVLYSPVFDIRQIRCDTLTFYMNKAMADGSRLYMQFLNFRQEWVMVENMTDTCTTWYNSEDGFTGNSNGRYVQRMARLATGDFPQFAQLRFIFFAAPGGANTSYGDGVAIDDLRLARAQRNVDVGVVDIIEPVNPRFGETTYPKVVIKNYGYETQHRVNLAYRPYGSNLSKTGLWTGTLEPGDTVHYKFDGPFIISADFPDTFSICAYTTMGTDLYWDNDSTCKEFYLAPLSHDLSVQTFVSPTDRVVAGDSLSITVRIRNYGTEAMQNISMTYEFNYQPAVTENLDFTQLVGPEGLGSMEYFNYTFKRKVRASLGYMNLTAWGSYAEDIYPYNDTISKHLEGITSIKDVAAIGVIADTTVQGIVRMSIVLENQGARSANDFDVFLWWDNDTTTMLHETFHRPMPLASLETTTWIFDTTLARRNQPWTNVCGYCVVPGDNIRSNDTTCTLMNPYVDLTCHRVELEENRNADCKVRLVVENVGTTIFSMKQRLSATVNGTTVSVLDSSRVMVPGVIYYIEIPNGRIPKDASRNYVGSGSTTSGADVNHANDATSIVQVVNYFEDIVDADAESGIILEQNHPNPFTNKTAIDFEIPEPGDVTFFVMDVMGRMVHHDTQNYVMGRNTIQFAADKLSSGTYFYGIIFDGKRVMRKMVIK